ncbi:sialidase-3-like [Amphiura filiformis]|uniref:sialidase-3-like n=1 Tax=Amphiura filiformis TaxID=82378 RepID=UPI003B21843E
MAKVKELVGRHIYLIVTVILLCMTCLIASIPGIASKIIAVVFFACSVYVGVKLVYRKWSPEVVFHMFMDGYVIFRLPGLLYHKDTFFAFFEARHGIQDWSRADIVMRKGQLLGSEVKWGPVQVVAHDDNYRCANPVPIIDRETNTIMVIFILLVPGTRCCDFIGKKFDQKINIVKSTDWGETWSREDITDCVLGSSDASFYASGPGHGIQLKSGRLVVPGKFNLKPEASQKASRLNTCDHSMIIYSDDHAETWTRGGHVPYHEDGYLRAIHTCEATILELQENQLCMNSRTLHPEHPRAQAFSYDGGLKFEPPQLPGNLVEQAYNECGYVNPARGGAPGCQGSLLGFPAPRITSSTQQMAPLIETHQTWALFSNPATRYLRFKMGIRLSKDGCQNWSKPWTIWRMASGYSDMAFISNPQEAGEEQEGQVQKAPSRESHELKFGILFESGLFFSGRLYPLLCLMQRK